MNYKLNKSAILCLADGTEYRGFSFGYPRSTTGEMVFCTAMTGYPESLTDPSYCGQILVATHPMMGNYGVPGDERDAYGLSRHFESDHIQCAALVATDYSASYSHADACRSLGEWLYDERIPALFGIDTRALTKKLRDEGAMPGTIVFDDSPVPPPFHDENRRTKQEQSKFVCSTLQGEGRAELNLVARVSTKQVQEYGHGRLKVLLVDCGVKNNILRLLLERGVSVRRVPWDHDFTHDDYDGLFISNGPGDPADCIPTIQHLRAALADDRPIMGICLGNQLLALAAGARTYKMKFGHRGHNQTVRQPGTHRCFVTAQNHGYAIDPTTLPDDWECLFENLNDGTNEGIRHKQKPFFSTQFHPEASSGPVDTMELFDQFIENMKQYKRLRI